MVPPDREQAIFDVLWRSGLGPLSREKAESFARQVAALPSQPTDDRHIIDIIRGVLDRVDADAEELLVAEGNDLGYGDNDGRAVEVYRAIKDRLRAAFSADEEANGTEFTEAEVTTLTERIKGRRWTIFVCAEPDGQDCGSGTHPYVVRHRCAAIKRFHASEGRKPGPRLAEVAVMWVEECERVQA